MSDLISTDRTRTNVILGTLGAAADWARAHNLKVRDWVFGGNAYALRGLAGPLHLIQLHSWADVQPAIVTAVERDIRLIEARYGKSTLVVQAKPHRPEVNPTGGAL